MRKFDAIIGYKTIKTKLLEICDMIKNPDIFEQMGATAIHGILLDGEPGVGKTMMAYAFIEECGLPSYVIRRTKPNGEFVNEIKRVFTEAAEHEPSIILLDDLDKFVVEEKKTEEYVVVQACMDEVRDKRVYVIATTNDTRDMPDSLLRAGRFDCRFRVDLPGEKDAEAVVAYYLQGKNLAPDVGISDVAKMMYRHSCASLETIINKAAMYAAYQRCEQICKRHIIRAYLEFFCSLGDDESTERKEKLKEVAYHEAGHAVVAELLLEGSVGAAVVCQGHRGRSEGLVRRCKEVYNMEDDIAISLGGALGVEVALGVSGGGAYEDYRHAFLALEGILDSGRFGVEFVQYRSFSERKRSNLELCEKIEIERIEREVRKMLVEHRDFLDAVAMALMEKQVLLSSDMRRLRDQYLSKKEN